MTANEQNQIAAVPSQAQLSDPNGLLYTAASPVLAGAFLAYSFFSTWRSEHLPTEDVFQFYQRVAGARFAVGLIPVLAVLLPTLALFRGLRLKKVSLDGDHMVISGGGQTARVPREQVSETVSLRSIIVVYFKTPTPFGSKIIFRPPWLARRKILTTLAAWKKSGP